MSEPVLANYVVERLRRPPSVPQIVAGSTPVLSFSNPSTATVATLGLNPSRQEFLDKDGRELTGAARRFETLASLGVSSLTSASSEAMQRVVSACNRYFQVNPYRRWFDQFEPILTSVGASYYAGSACHLDLVQWATDPVWGTLKDRGLQDQLLAKDAGFLRQQLVTGVFRLLLINGTGVSQVFERAFGLTLRPAGHVVDASVTARLSVGRLPFGTRVIAWSVNLQSSFGVTNVLRAALAHRVAALSQEGAVI